MDNDPGRPVSTRRSEFLGGRKVRIPFGRGASARCTKQRRQKDPDLEESGSGKHPSIFLVPERKVKESTRARLHLICSLHLKIMDLFLTRRRRNLILCCIGAFLVATSSGCSGVKLRKFENGGALPDDLSQEVKNKFHTTEFSATSASAPGSTARLVADKKKGKRGKKDASPPPVSAATQSATDNGGLPLPSYWAPQDPTKPFTYPNLRPAKDPVWIGEKQVFSISYFGVKAGEFAMEALPLKQINNRKVYHIRGEAESSTVFSVFYRLHDVLESWIDYEGFFSHKLHVVLDESIQTRDSLELYDSEKRQAYYWTRWDHKNKGFIEKKEFHDIPPFPQETVSALFYLRAIPLPDGAQLQFPVISEGKTLDATVKVLRREMMNTPLGRVNTIVVQPSISFKGVLQQKGDSFIWLTDDDRRFLVRLEAKVKVGTVVANLKEVVLGTPPAPTAPN